MIDRDEDIYSELDTFDHANRQPGGLAGRFVEIHWQSADDRYTDNDRIPLPHGSLSIEEIADLQDALMRDPQAHIYVGVRHLYLGLPIVTLVVQVGAAVTPGAVRLERRDTRDGFVVDAVESRESALAGLSGPGRKLLREIANEALAQVVAMLKEKESQRA